MLRPSTIAVLALGGASASPVKHVVTLMMENRAFDHFLGHLAFSNPKIDGLTGSESNPVRVDQPDGPRVPVNFDAVDGGPVDPYHDFDSITQQIFGARTPANPTTPPRMDGFVDNARTHPWAHGPKVQRFVMSAFNTSNLPVLSKLATEFALFDDWYCSCPCPTNPNREFLMSGTTHGFTVNDFPKGGFPQESHLAFLLRHNKTSKIYYHDNPWMASVFADLQSPEALALVQEMPHFYSDLAHGTLPQYSLIQPRMASSHTGPSNWQHPDNSVSAGEALLAAVYDALRASRHWNDTLLVITYDEHGGFFDHKPPPSKGVPPPDDVPGDNGFKFDRLGVRVPTILVSPWIAKGTLVSKPSGARAPTATSQYEATSIIASTNRLLGIEANLTRRDAWAATFHDLVDGSSGLRTDCPATMPHVAPPSASSLRAEGALPLNDHHLESLDVLCGQARHAHAACAGFGSTAPKARAQAEFVAALDPAPAHDALAGAGAPHEAPRAFAQLHAPAARRLRQREFGDISAALYAEYRRLVLADE